MPCEAWDWLNLAAWALENAAKVLDKDHLDEQHLHEVSCKLCEVRSYFFAVEWAMRKKAAGQLNAEKVKNI